MTQIATKFVKWDIPELATLQDSKVYKLRVHLNNGGKLNLSLIHIFWYNLVPRGWLFFCHRIDGQSRHGGTGKYALQRSRRGRCV